MKILIINDNTITQINGVNTTYSHLKEELIEMGHDVKILTPDSFFHIPLPFYKDVKISINTDKVRKYIKKYSPDRIHIATEGPLGFFSKLYCDMSGLKYTTSYHTKFPEYIYKYSNNMIPCSFSMSYFKWFHENSDGVFVSTNSMRVELEDNGFKNIKMWSRGVDHSIFNIHENKIKNDYKKPIWVYCGRVSIEKNIEFFLKLDLEGEKIVIGDGPDLQRLKKEYNSVHFVGKKNKREITDIFNVCDCFIFPSKTDTFGIVIIEALACGLPVVAFDVTGPKDILNNNIGRLCSEDNFVEGCNEAILIRKEDCYNYAQKYTWENVAKQFI